MYRQITSQNYTYKIPVNLNNIWILINYALQHCALFSVFYTFLHLFYTSLSFLNHIWDIRGNDVANYLLPCWVFNISSEINRPYVTPQCLLGMYWTAFIFFLLFIYPSKEEHKATLTKHHLNPVKYKFYLELKNNFKNISQNYGTQESIKFAYSFLLA